MRCARDRPGRRRPITPTRSGRQVAITSGSPRSVSTRTPLECDVASSASACADPTKASGLYFVHTGHARFRVAVGHDAPAGTFVSALDVKTIRSAVAPADNTVVHVIGAETGAPFEVTPAERAELAAAGVPANPA